MKIYEIEQKKREVFESSVDGEVDNELLCMLDSEKDVAMLSYAKYIKEKEAEVLAMKEAEKSIAQRRKSLENYVKRSKSYLLERLDDPLSDDFVKLAKRKSTVVMFNDDHCGDFAGEYLNDHRDFISVKEVISVDKNSLKALLKDDPDSVPGAWLEDKQNLVIS